MEKVIIMILLSFLNIDHGKGYATFNYEGKEYAVKIEDSRFSIPGRITNLKIYDNFTYYSNGINLYNKQSRSEIFGEEITISKKPLTVYDTMGRKVDEMNSGIYFINTGFITIKFYNEGCISVDDVLTYVLRK